MSHGRVGVISIRRTIETQAPFSEIYSAVGLNTGNFMFTEAIYRQIEGTTTQVDFVFDPDWVNNELDALLIPAANWLNNDLDWNWFCDILEKVRIPVITIGLGLQTHADILLDIDLNESCVRLAKTLASKANYISTRGYSTLSFLNSIGIMNAVATGCPSLYLPFPQSLPPTSLRPIVIQSTRYGITRSFVDHDNINLQLYRLAARIGADLVYQSEPEEMEYLLTKASKAAIFTDRCQEWLPKIYGTLDYSSFFNYVTQHGRIFLSIDDWSCYLRNTAGQIGTRLHGAILALNSGIPAALIAHDTRTSEMITFAGIPTCNLDVTNADADEIRSLLAEIKLDKYHRTRLGNLQIYKNFLANNNLKWSTSGLPHEPSPLQEE